MTANRRRILEQCTGCSRTEVPNFGYELCSRCYRREHRVPRMIDTGELNRRTWRREVLIGEVAFLAERGTAAADLPGKLGVQWDSITLAHRRAGVPLPLRYRYGVGDLR